MSRRVKNMNVRRRLQFGVETREETENSGDYGQGMQQNLETQEEELVIFTQGKPRRRNEYQNQSQNQNQNQVCRTEETETTEKVLKQHQTMEIQTPEKKKATLLETSPLYGREEERVIKRPVSPLLLWSEMDFSPKFTHFDGQQNSSDCFEYGFGLSQPQQQYLNNNNNTCQFATNREQTDGESFFQTEFEPYKLRLMIN